MRFEVPQFIEIEDKIFGPLTWKQFVYIAGGGGLAAALFFFTPFIVFALLGIPIAGITFLLSFYPVNNRPFSVFLESMVGYLRGNKIYFWRKRGTGVYHGAQTENSSAPVYTPPQNANQITSLSRRLEMKAIQSDN